MWQAGASWGEALGSRPWAYSGLWFESFPVDSGWAEGTAPGLAQHRPKGQEPAPTVTLPAGLKGRGVTGRMKSRSQQPVSPSRLLGARPCAVNRMAPPEPPRVLWAPRGAAGPPSVGLPGSASGDTGLVRAGQGAAAPHSPALSGFACRRSHFLRPPTGREDGGAFRG